MTSAGRAPSLSDSPVSDDNRRFHECGHAFGQGQRHLFRSGRSGTVAEFAEYAPGLAANTSSHEGAAEDAEGQALRRHLAFSAIAPAPVLVTIKDVPLLSTGMDFHISTGVMTVTTEALADAAMAYSDVAVPKPRLKLGHTDPRYNNEATFDGTPAFGRAENLRLSDDGQTLYGDFVGVPQWLASVMPIAYMNRSVEGESDFTTVSGKKYRLVIDAVALLGVTWPGCSVLPDLPLYYGDQIPPDVQIEGLTGVAMSGSRITASANIDDVRRMFYSEFATEEKDRYWWWIRAMYTEPNELIVDDDKGQLYKVSYSTSSDGEVTFGDAVPVKIEYQNDPKKDVVAAASAAVQPGRIAATWSSRDDSRINASQEGGSSLDPKQLRQSLGLPEDATDEQVLAAVNASLAGQTDPGTDPPQAPDAPTPDPTPDPEPTPQPEPAEPLAVAASGLVQIDSSALEELRRNAALGAQAREQQLTAERDGFLASAVTAGKFPPSRVDHYRQMWAADPQGTRELVDGLASGLVPVSEVGVSAGPDAVEDEAHLAWFPEIRAARATDAAMKSGLTSGTIVMGRD